MKTGDLVKYDDLPLGARFHHINDSTSLKKEVWVKLLNGGLGKIVHWTGLTEPTKHRSMCCAEGSSEARAAMRVIVAEDFIPLSLSLLDALKPILETVEGYGVTLSHEEAARIVEVVEGPRKAAVPIVLSPCPFTRCKGAKKAVHFITPEQLHAVFCKEELEQYSVICDNLMGGCGSSTGFYPTQEEAARLWNERS